MSVSRKLNLWWAAVLIAPWCSIAVRAEPRALSISSAAPKSQEMTNDGLNSPAMEQARKALKKRHGGQNNFLALGERFEKVITSDKPTYNWEAQAWYGGDLNKAWFKTEGV